MSLSNGGARNRDFLSPVTPTGQVLFNGAIAQGAVIAAMQNKSPLYPLPGGQFQEMVGRVRVADVVYKFIDDNDYLQSSYNRNMNATTSGLSSINGQGYAGESQHSFLSRIQVLGLAFMENDKNGSKLFNIHCGGLYTVVNTGNEDLVAGGWVMVYAPRLDEVKEGGRGEDADANGLITLWLKPYHPEIHRNTPKHLYHCLTRLNMGKDIHTTADGKAYLPEYEDQCNDIFDSFLDIGLIFTEYLRTSGLIKLEVDGKEIESVRLYSNILEKLGHRRFYNIKNLNSLKRQELLNAFFLPQLTRKTTDYDEANYFYGTDEDSKNLRGCQLEAVSIALVTQARFIHTITKNIIGKCITSMAPKENGQLQLCAYIGSK